MSSWAQNGWHDHMQNPGDTPDPVPDSTFRLRDKTERELALAVFEPTSDPEVSLMGLVVRQLIDIDRYHPLSLDTRPYNDQIPPPEHYAGLIDSSRTMIAGRADMYAEKVAAQEVLLGSQPTNVDGQESAVHEAVRKPFPTAEEVITAAEDKVRNAQMDDLREALRSSIPRLCVTYVEMG